MEFRRVLFRSGHNASIVFAQAWAKPHLSVLVSQFGVYSNRLSCDPLKPMPHTTMPLAPGQAVRTGPQRLQGRPGWKARLRSEFAVAAWRNADLSSPFRINSFTSVSEP